MINRLFFLAIFAFCILLRTYNLQNYPPLLWDEAALGYNSFSILKTGKDEHGQVLPFVFKSFGDYKPGLYIYTLLPFIQAFGVNTLSTRLPSVIFGVLICFLLYKLTKSKSVFLLASSNPFLIHYSRGAWETNLSTFLLLFSLYCFLQKKPLLATLLLGLNLYAYQSGKLNSLLFFTYYFYNQPKTFLSKLPILLILAFPIAYGLLFSSDSNRLQVVSLFSYPRTPVEIETIKQGSGEINYNLFANQSIFFIKNFATRYLNHFSPQFLFTQGDWQSPRHSAPYTGVLLLTSIIFLPIGLLNFKKNNLDKIMLFWLIVSPIAASLTRDQIQATRSMSFAVPLVYFSGLGLKHILHHYKKLGYIFIVLFIFSLVYYLDLYHNHMIQKSPKDWLYGYNEVVNKINSKTYSHVYFTDFYGQPYIYYLFYSKYNPAKYQQRDKFTSQGLDTGSVKLIDDISFFSSDFSSIKNDKNVLVIYSHDEILRQGLDIKQFKPFGVVGDIATFYIYETN